MFKRLDNVTKSTIAVFSSFIGRSANRYGDIQNFEKIISVSDLFATGKVHLISLQYLKEQLGFSWYGKRDEILKKLSIRLKQNTNDEDVIFSRSETEHLVVFSNTPQSDAQQLCGDILKKLSTEYLGQCYDCNVIIRTATGRRHGKLLFQDVAYSSIKNSTPDIIEQAPKPKLESFPSPIDEKKERPYELIYKPIWDKKNNIVSTFMISLRSNKKKKGSNSDTSPIGYRSLPNPFCLASMIELDKYMLDEIIEMMQDFFKNNFRAMFAIPLHYKTLFNLTRLHNFLFHCQSIPIPLRKYITFSLIGFPEGFPEARMNLITTSLQKFCRNVTIVSEKIPSDIGYYKGCGVSGICLFIPEKIKSTKGYSYGLNKLAKKCAKENIKLSLDGVDKFEELEPIKETELDYISGNIIGRYEDASLHITHMGWNDIVKH